MTEPANAEPIADATTAPGADRALVAGRAAAVVSQALAQALAPGLHLVATPIGNLADITLRALAVLARADAIYCEDTRHSRTLIAHYAIATRLHAYHEHNAEAARPEILARLARGEAVALISDAGTPLVSDPGYKLVRAALHAGHLVTSLPGPSAPIAALAQSGLPTDAFVFAGFLPTKQMARRTRLAEFKSVPATLIVFEAPGRVADCLADIASVLGDPETAVARELTKRHEEVRRGPASALAQHFESGERRGEFVILVAPPKAPLDASDADISERLQVLLASMSLKDAVQAAAAELGCARTRVYDLALALKRGTQ